MDFVKLIRLELLLLRRWVWENLFTLVVIVPLVIGGAGLIFQPYLEAAGSALRSEAGAWVAANAGAVAGALAVGLLLARLSGTIRDVFALDESDFYVDALPVAPVARLHAVLVLRAAKALPVALAVLFGLYLAAPAGTTLAALAAASAAPLAAAAAALGVVETGAALALVRLRVVGSARLVAVGALAIAAATAAGSLAGWAAAGALVAAAYALSLYGFVRWRIEERDVAREALARARRSSPRLERLADRWFGPRVGAQVVRDLRLVRRGFSTEPYVALGAALLLPALAVWLGERYALAPSGRARAVEVATVLSAFALSAVTHALVRYERTRIWIDLVSGVERDAFPRAKVWVGRALAAPAFVAGAVAMAAAGAGPDLWGLVKLGWLAWSTASLTALLCYEIKERPAAGLVLALLPAVGLALLIVFYEAGHLLWWLSLFGYFYVSFHLLGRAALKVAWD